MLFIERIKRYSDMGKIKYGEHKNQYLKVYLPDTDKFPVCVYLHGGGLEEGVPEQEFADSLVNKGVAVVSGQYRLYPDAKYPEFIEDGASIVAWAKNNMPQYGDVTKLFVVGTSAGAYISMMLCFDKKYLAKHGMSNDDVSGYLHNAGQPTTHFNVLRERGLDSRHAIIDEAAPLYHICEDNYPPMEIVVADNDMECRYEETKLLMAKLAQFGHDMSKINFRLMENYGHCEYKNVIDENGNYIFADIIYNFISRNVK